MSLLCLDKFSSGRANGFTEEQRPHSRDWGSPCPVSDEALQKPSAALGSDSKLLRTQPITHNVQWTPSPLGHQTQKTLNYYLVLEEKYIESIVLASKAASVKIKALAAFLLS